MGANKKALFLGGFFVLMILFYPAQIKDKAAVVASFNTAAKQVTVTEVTKETLEKRKEKLLSEIKTNPGILKQSLLSDQEKGKIPPELQGLIEKEAEVRGKLTVFRTTDVQNKIDETQYLLTEQTTGETFEILFVKEEKKEKNLKSSPAVVAKGLSLGGYLVVDGAEALFSQSGSETRPLVNGNRDVLVVYHQFSDLGFSNNLDGTGDLFDYDDTITKTEIEAKVTTNADSVSNYYDEVSYNNLNFNFTVTNLLTSAYVTGGPSTNPTCNITNIRTAADTAAAAYNPASYDHVIYLFPFMPSCSLGGTWAGLGEVGGRHVWINGYNTSFVLGHELGHNIGLGHANSLDCGSKTIDVYANCTQSEYGDWYDLMGYGYDHFNAIEKEYLGWIPGRVQTVTTSGTFTLYPLENGDNNTKALKISKGDTGDYYYLEYRTATGLDNDLPAGVTKGVLGHLVGSSGEDTYILDFSPQNNLNDAALADGETFTDSGNNISVTQNSHNSGSVNVTITFNVTPPSNPVANMVPVHRFWNVAGTHFYTISEAEKNNVIARWPTTYKYEGIAYYVNTNSAKNSTPLYRLWNSNGTHFYTASYAEATNAVTRWPGTFRLEGIAYYVSMDPSGTTPVHRFWNNRGTHFYTISDAEKNNIISRWPGTYRYEGVGYWIGG